MTKKKLLVSQLTFITNEMKSLKVKLQLLSLPLIVLTMMHIQTQSVVLFIKNTDRLGEMKMSWFQSDMVVNLVGTVTVNQTWYEILLHMKKS